MNEIIRTQWINATVRVIIKNAIRRAANNGEYQFWPMESTPRLVDIARCVDANVQEEADRFAIVGCGKPGLTEQEREIMLDAADFAVKLFKRERLI